MNTSFYSPWGQSGRSWRWSGHFENHHQTLHQQYSPAWQEDPPWMVLQRPRVWECHLIAENWLRSTGWTLQLPSLHHGPEWMGTQWHLARPFPVGLLIDPSLWMPDCTHEDPQLHAGITDGHFYHKVIAFWSFFYFVQKFPKKLGVLHVSGHIFCCQEKRRVIWKVSDWLETVVWSDAIQMTWLSSWQQKTLDLTYSLWGSFWLEWSLSY